MTICAPDGRIWRLEAEGLDGVRETCYCMMAFLWRYRRRFAVTPV